MLHCFVVQKFFIAYFPIPQISDLKTLDVLYKYSEIWDSKYLFAASEIASNLSLELLGSLLFIDDILAYKWQSIVTNGAPLTKSTFILFFLFLYKYKSIVLFSSSGSGIEIVEDLKSLVIIKWATLSIAVNSPN